MNSPTTFPRQQRRLCDAIGEALSVTWADVMPQPDKGLIQVEYEPGSEHSIDWLKVWSSTKRGHWNLVCEYWMAEHPFGKAGLQFASGYHSDVLGESLRLIMQHQPQFASPEGSLNLIQVYPPAAAENA
jgi:hypothetical protein